jgi:hypothetical protein
MGEGLLCTSTLALTPRSAVCPASRLLCQDAPSFATGQNRHQVLAAVVVGAVGGRQAELGVVGVLARGELVENVAHAATCFFGERW